MQRQSKGRWGTIKAVVLRAPRELAVEDVPVPEPGYGQVLLKVTDCGICGSDVRYFHGENPWALHTLGEELPNPENMILGHEVAGVIDSVGPGVSPDAISKRVGVLCFCVDGTCYWCRRGEEQLCPNTMHLGHAAGWGESKYYYGGMAEYVPVWADHCYELPNTVSNEAASLLDPMGVAVHGVLRANIRPGEAVLTVGAGPIGMFCVQAATAFGAGYVACSDLDPRILEMAVSLGADVGVDASADDPGEVMAGVTRGRGADVIFDSAGLPLSNSLGMLARGGRLMLFVVHRKAEAITTLDLSSERTVTSVANFAYPDFQMCIDLLATGRVKAEPLITHRFPLEDALEAFRVADHKAETGAIKVLLKISD